MNAATATIARAFVDLARSLPASERVPLADAVVTLLARRGLLRNAREFTMFVDRLLRSQEKVVHAVVTTPTGNAGPLKTEFKRIIENAMGRSADVEERQDSTLLGGIRLAIGDERFDASLRRSVNDLAALILKPVPLPSL